LCLKLFGLILILTFDLLTSNAMSLSLYRTAPKLL